MKNIILVLTGGALGSLARYTVSELTSKYLLGFFPYGTLLVNLAGCLLIGILCGAWGEGNVPNTARLFLIIGMIGGFTTFSAYAFESFNLFKIGLVKIALFNILANNLIGILLVFLGFYLGQGLLKIIN